MFKKTFTALLLGSVLASGAVSAADYVIDQEGQHAFVNFKISHLGYSTAGYTAPLKILMALSAMTQHNQKPAKSM